MASYDPVAEQYHQTFSHPSLRPPEWAFLQDQLKASDRKEQSVLDLGCGNGYLSRELSPYFKSVFGLDESELLLDFANTVNNPDGKITYLHTSHLARDWVYTLGLTQIDVVISLLSFRYMDWDLTIKELIKLMNPGSEFIIIDMCASSLSLSQLPLFIRTKLMTNKLHKRNPQFAENLHKLSNSKSWKEMVANNPAKPLKEYDQFINRLVLTRKFSLQERKVLSVSRKHCTVAWVLKKI
jgi:SAM-dependent methyltransferase